MELLSSRLRRRRYKVKFISDRELITEREHSFAESVEKTADEISSFLRGKKRQKYLSFVDHRCEASFAVEGNDMKITYDFLDDLADPEMGKMCEMEVYHILDNVFGFIDLKRKLEHIPPIERQKGYSLAINELRQFASVSTSILFAGILFLLIVYYIPPSHLIMRGPFVAVIHDSVNGPLYTHWINLDVWLLNLFVSFSALLIYLVLRTEVDARIAKHLIDVEKELRSLTSQDNLPFLKHRVLKDLEFRPKKWSRNRLLLFILIATLPVVILWLAYDAIAVMILSPLIFFVYYYASEALISSFQTPSDPSGDWTKKARWYSLTALSLPACVWTLFLYNSYLDMSELSTQFLGSVHMKTIIFLFLYCIYLIYWMFSFSLYAFSRVKISAEPKKSMEIKEVIQTLISLGIALLIMSASFPTPRIDVSTLGIANSADISIELAILIIGWIIEGAYFVFLQIVPVTLLFLSLAIGVVWMISKKVRMKDFKDACKRLRSKNVLVQVTQDFAEEVIIPISVYFASLLMLSLSFVSIGAFGLSLQFFPLFLLFYILMTAQVVYKKMKLSKMLKPLRDWLLS